jgi:hypothetical protein
VIVGGFGALSWGSSLVTRDVDVACDLNPTNLLKVWEALKGLHPIHRMTPDRLAFTREQAERADWKNLYLTTALGQLDLLGEVKGIGGFEECLANSECIPISGREVRVLSLDAMIVSKRAMGRPRDLHAALELEAIRERREDKGSR